MASLLPKISWKRLTKRENKNTIMKLWHPFMPKQVGKGREREKIKIIGTFLSYTTRNRKFQKIAKKIKKTKNHHFGNFSGQNKLGKAGKERKLKKKNRSNEFLPNP